MSTTPEGDRGLTIRTLDDDDLTTFSEVLAAAFLTDFSDDVVNEERTVFDPERCHAVFDGETMIGTGQMLRRRITLPGTGPIPVAAVTSVGVAPGHRRRGVLSTIMRTQLNSLHEQGGEPIAALWASEGGIYGRFGYGLATQYQRLVIPRGAAFRPDVDIDPTRVRELPKDQAMPLIREVYEKVWPTRVGYLERTDAHWAFHLLDQASQRQGQTTLRFAIHPEGYALYRARFSWEDRGPRSALTVHSIAATNPRAYAAICRYLLDVDMVGEVIFRVGMDDPIGLLLADPRCAVRTVLDGLWVRLVDVDRALAARGYSAPLDVVFDVTDELCPWNAGRWRMSIKDGQADVRRTDESADLALDVNALGAAYLGGPRLSALAAAGRVRELTPGALARTSVAFLHDREPSCPELF